MIVLDMDEYTYSYNGKVFVEETLPWIKEYDEVGMKLRENEELVILADHIEFVVKKGAVAIIVIDTIEGASKRDVEDYRALAEEARKKYTGYGKTIRYYVQENEVVCS